MMRRHFVTAARPFARPMSTLSGVFASPRLALRRAPLAASPATFACGSVTTGRFCATAAPHQEAAPSQGGASNASEQNTTADDKEWIPASNKSVARWLYMTAGFVGGIVIVGGITRLTESGLSIVEWKPVRGIVPPITAADWEDEFDKYKKFPEFQQKPDMTMSEFKYIFFWEWFHRVLARGVGLVFGGPLVYYASKGYFAGNKKFLAKLCGCMALGGCQGAMGWYMVKSGLKKELLDERQKATVSAYRLAAHLTLAFTIFASLVRLGLSLKTRPAYIANPVIPGMARICTGSMFITAVSGAFVAGLDAGLLYCDTFPLMGEGVFPPGEDVLALHPPLRNLFENGTAAQLWHRLMAGTTTWFILSLNFALYRHRTTVPLQVRKAIKGVNHALAFQVLLGFATLMTYVSTPVAALHQLNSLMLLAMLLRLNASLTRRHPVMLKAR